jgi:hypothetical protein
LENNEKLKEGGYFFTIMLFDLNDRVEIVQPDVETKINLLLPKIEELKINDTTE